MWFYNVEYKTFQKEIPKDLLKYYPSNLSKIAYEHPREITAYLLAENKKYHDEPILKKLIELLGHTAINIDDFHITENK